MKNIPLKFILAATLAVAATLTSRAAPAAREIVITANDTLKFDVTRIQAHPGEVLHVQLRNEGTMPKDSMGHDWILLRAGADPMTYAMTAMAARAQGYQPKALQGEVLAAIPLLGPREVGDVTFTAPTKPGKYVYICSCSGHALAGMRGELIVK
jgi:azurin